MLVSNRPTHEELAKTYAVFLPKERIGYTALPETQKIKEDKFEKKYGLLYTGAALATAGTIFTVLYRGGKFFNFTKFVKKYATRITASTLETLKNATSQNLDFFQRTKLKIAVGASNFLRKLQGFGNINPIKDIAVDRTLIKIEDKLKIKVKTFFDKITAFFVKYGKKLARSKYNAPQKTLLSFRGTLALAADEIEKLPAEALGGKSAKELSARLRQLSQLSADEFQKIVSGFGTRFDHTVSTLNSNSEAKFMDTLTSLKGNSATERIISKVKEFGDFIPVKNMEPYYQEIFAPLFASKNVVSNNILDLHKALTTSLDNIFYDNSLQNPLLRKNYLNLLKLVEKFMNPKKFNLTRANVKTELITELQSAVENFSKIMPDSQKSKQVQAILNTLQTDKRGAIEEAVKLCKVLKEYNPQLYLKLIEQRNKFQKTFNNAINFETDKSYRKLLDFSLHSLTTDLFTQMAGVGTVLAILLNTKQSANEKIPAVLQKGIPVAGGLLVGFMCNLRQVASGPGALFLALISGFALNRIGTVISNKFVDQTDANIAAKKTEK